MSCYISTFITTHDKVVCEVYNLDERTAFYLALPATSPMMKKNSSLSKIKS